MLIPFGVFSAAGAGGGGGGGTPAYELISTVNGNGSSDTITLSSIPSDYKHLQIRGVARTGSAYGSTALSMQLNGATNNYAWHELYGDGSSVGSAASTGSSSISVGRIPSFTGTSGVYGSFIIDILDYASTSKNKTVRILYGVIDSGVSNVGVAIRSGFLNSTSAISSISFTANSSLPFTSISRISLYGLKGN